jgi:hypothetical protein
MPLTGAAIAGVLVLGGVGFGGGYALASMGGDEGGTKQPSGTSREASLPPVPSPTSKPKVVVLGSAAALPAPKRQKRRSSRPDPGPSSTPGPEPTAAPTSAPTAAPTSAPTSAPPQPTPPPNDDIIEG